MIYSVAAGVAICRYNSLHWRSVWVHFVSVTLGVLCIASTVFVKQHSVIDLIAGLFVSSLLYFLIYGLKNGKRRQKGEQPEQVTVSQ